MTTVRNTSAEQWAYGSVDLTDANGNDLSRFNYIAMVFNEPSEYGIRNGRVSKLQLNPAGSWTGIDSAVAIYDRGWNVVPDPMSNVSWAVEVILLHYSEHGASEPDDAQRTFRAVFSMRNPIDGKTTFHERLIDAHDFDSAQKIANKIVEDGFEVDACRLSMTNLYEI